MRFREDVRTAMPKLAAGHYKTLYVDPPWDWMFGGGGAEKVSRLTGRSNKSPVGATPYARMSVDELLALGAEVRRTAAPGCHLYLWTVNKTVPDAARLIEEWGFRWVSMVTWDKGRPGIAKYFQGVTEHCVFAARGSLPYKFVDGKMQQGQDAAGRAAPRTLREAGGDARYDRKGFARTVPRTVRAPGPAALGRHRERIGGRMNCAACGAPLGARHLQSYGAPWIDQAGGTYHDCPIGGLYGKVKEGHCRPSLWNRFLIWSNPGYFNGTNAKENR